MALSQDMLLIFSLAYTVKPKQVPLPEIPLNLSLPYHCKAISQRDRLLNGKYKWCSQKSLVSNPLQHQESLDHWGRSECKFTGGTQGIKSQHLVAFFAVSPMVQANCSELSGHWSCLALSPSCATHVCTNHFPQPPHVHCKHRQVNIPLLQTETWHSWWQLLTQLFEFHFLRRFQPVKLSYSCKTYAKMRQAQQMKSLLRTWTNFGGKCFLFFPW